MRLRELYVREIILQICEGKVTTLHLYQGAFVDVGGVYDGYSCLLTYQQINLPFFLVILPLSLLLSLKITSNH